MGNAFSSLRRLAVLDWTECFDRLSMVERVLRLDPAGIYPRIDFPTRDRYRRAIEDLHRGSGLEEEQVALRWAHVHHTAVYFTGLAFFTAAVMFPVLRFGLLAHGPGVRLVFEALLLIPASQLSLEIMNTLIVRFFPPRALPKMDFKISGIPDACRTLVVVPMMLVDQETIEAEAEKLEIRYLANKEANLLFGLFSDYTDATRAHCEEDEALLQCTKERIEALNQRRGGGRFFLFHRDRTWSESERKFIGWERKRGNLEELNELIVGTRKPGAGPLVRVGDRDGLSDVRFVITLDSDTQLPAGAARRMIETLAHPFNRARLDEAGHVRSGYTIIQPRVSTSLPSTSGSPFSRLFTEPVGIDPYANTVSDAYQDLTGEGSYHGKGIYDVRAFSRVLSGRFPEARLLSHDLLEGAHVRVGLTSDIELYDEFPQDYLGYTRRQHRWIRGDWQIADWIMPRVPLPGGGRGPNPLSWFDRWKIFDNLRRSMLPAASLGLLATAWLVSPRAGWVAGAVVASQLLFHSLAQPFTRATTGQGLRGISPAGTAHDLLRVLVEAALMPHQAWLALDAAARAWYRRCISHRGLLEWASAQVMQDGARVPALLPAMGLASVLSALGGWAVVYGRPAALGAAGPWLLLWFVAPLIGWLLGRRPPAAGEAAAMPGSGRGPALPPERCAAHLALFLGFRE